MEEKIKEKADRPIIRLGEDKPADVPGRKWLPVRNNPLKPQQIRAWRLGELATGETLLRDESGEETVVEGSQRENPPIMGGRTEDEVEESRRTSKVVSGTKEGLPIGDRD